MNNIDLFKVFVHMDDGLKDKNIRELLERKRYREDARMSLSELATLQVAFQHGAFRHMKAFWLHVKTWLSHLFPNLVCYSRFMMWMREAGKAVELLLEENLSKWDGFGLLDSSKLPVAHQDRRGPKVFRKTASYGHTAFGRFYGFKLHLLCDRNGKIIRWGLTTGSVHDLSPVKEGFLDGLEGMVLADSGYVSRDERFRLMSGNLDFVARPRKNQDEWDRDAWERKYGKIYKLRQRVEGVFNDLKNNGMMVSFRHHHPDSVRVYVVSALLAYQLLFVL